jgi:hypothetical protein
MNKNERIIGTITDYYLSSGDFNGMPLSKICDDFNLSNDNIKKVLIRYIRENEVSLVFGDIHPNPYIKAFKEEDQTKQIDKLMKSDIKHVCIYPTPSHLRKIIKKEEYSGKPFTFKLAIGEPQMTFYSFDLTILDFYHNDPQYRYCNNDISGMICYNSEDMEDSDKIVLESFGFSYNKEMERAVAVFLIYLSRLSAEHQQIWNAKLKKGEFLLHPGYMQSSLGEWPDKVSIFDAFVEELHHINEMCKIIGRPPLFRKTFHDEEKPKDFCFVLRPTLKKYNEFLSLLDKMISQNINKDFFLNDITHKQEITRKNGHIEVRQIGTIQLLDNWLRKKFKTGDRKPIEEMIATFKRVRKMRQHPAHKIEEDVYDPNYFKKQRDIIIKAYSSIRLIRLMLANHPNLRNYEVPDWLFYGKIWSY